jgi:hypothetical protein
MLGRVVAAIVALYVAAGVLVLVLYYPAGYRGPISPTEIALALFSLAYGAVSTLGDMTGTALQEPVKVWELIVAGFLIVAAVKAAVANALAPMHRALSRIYEYDAPD